ncbi:LysR family transcriptional regulator [Amycolatopsis rubida]|uniref:LysR family transcriptional regulator n=1 Tax=Amycolatopsis rubida TaxID=112413 RepID=A0ABX0BYM5_9PSEU|nr:LysR family transcriptional regulator [Amycolatopsis rubida]NEC59337.1 LysR family transcriptional regulator [Amycolatopsis rubida]
MDLRRWWYFAVLAEEMNFTRAAQRLFISQPSLSQQIRVLEREFDTALLDRDGPRFRLTEAGRVAAEEARRLLEKVDRAQAKVRAAGRGETGRLRVAHTRSAPGPRASALVAAFRRCHPEVAIEAETGWTSRNVEQLESGEIDVAFVRPPIDSALLEEVIVDEEEILIALPAAHPLAEFERLERRQLAGEPVVFWSRDNGPGWYDQIREQVWPGHQPTVVWEEPDDEQLLHSVAAAAGIAAVPEHRARGLNVAGVALLRLADPVPRTHLALAYRRGEHNPLVANFVALARREPAVPPGQ